MTTPARLESNRLWGLRMKMAQVKAFRDNSDHSHLAVNEGMVLDLDFILHFERGSSNQPAANDDDVHTFLSRRGINR